MYYNVPFIHRGRSDLRESLRMKVVAQKLIKIEDFQFGNKNVFILQNNL